MRIILTIGWVLTAMAAMAATSFAYQGVLQDATGAAMANRSVSISFWLYAAASGGYPLWGRSVNVQTDGQGKFNVELNDSLPQGAGMRGTLDEALAATVAKDLPLYAGMSIDGDAEIFPRQKILVAPVASVAKSIRRAGGGFAVDGKVTFNGGATFAGNTTFNGDAILAGKTQFSQQAVFEQGVKMTTGAIGTMPVGSIVMWWGDVGGIPRGWALCNGQNVDLGSGQHYPTPDLRNRIPLGVSAAHGRGTSGGAPTVKLTIDTMPRHDHRFAHDVYGVVSGFPRGDAYSGTTGFSYTDSYKLNVYDTIDPGSGESGGDQPHNNLPPYTAVYFIIRVK